VNPKALTGFISRCSESLFAPSEFLPEHLTSNLGKKKPLCHDFMVALISQNSLSYYHQAWFNYWNVWKNRVPRRFSSLQFSEV